MFQCERCKQATVEARTVYVTSWTVASLGQTVFFLGLAVVFYGGRTSLRISSQMDQFAQVGYPALAVALAVLAFGVCMVIGGLVLSLSRRAWVCPSCGCTYPRA